MKRISLALVSLFGLVASAFAQTSYNRFGPVNGVLVGDSSTFYTSAADSTDIIGLWSGTCNLSSFLRGDGTCAAPTITGQALTRVDDTNVTLTLGGSPSTALVNPASLTLGWTGQLAPSRGGTGVSSLGNLTDVDDTNVTLTLGGTPTGALINSTSITAGWTGTLAVSRGGIGVGTLTGIAKGNGTSAFTAAASSDVISTWTGTCNSTTFLRADGTCQTVGSGSGSVTSITFGSGLTASPNPITTSGTASLDLSSTNAWTGLQTFGNTGTSTMAGSFSIGSSAATPTGGVLTIRPSAGTAAIRMQSRTDTTDDANWMQWYRANGSTERGWIGFGSNGSDQMSVVSQLGALTLQASGGNIALTPSSGTVTTNGLAAIERGSTAQAVTVNSTNANGPYITLQRSGVATADIGNGVNCGGSFTSDALCFSARSGNALQMAAGGRTSPDVSITSAGSFDVNLNATMGGTLVVDPSGGADELTVTNGAVTMTGTVSLPSTTTINSQNVCLANGTNCPASGGPTTIYKASAEDRSSTTTLTTDTDLTFTSAASAVYKIEFCLNFGGVTTGTQGFKFAFNKTAGGSDPGQWGGSSRVNAGGAAHDGIRLGDGTGSTTGQVAFATISVGNQQDSVCGSGMLVTNGTSSYAIQWAQNSSSGNATRLGQGSFIQYQRIN